MNYDNPLQRGLSDAKNKRSLEQQEECERLAIWKQQLKKNEDVIDNLYELLRHKIDTTKLAIHKGNVNQILGSFGGRKVTNGYDRVGIVLERKNMRMEPYLFGILSRNVPIECDYAYTIVVSIKGELNKDIGMSIEFKSWRMGLGTNLFWFPDYDDSDSLSPKRKVFTSDTEDDFLYSLGKDYSDLFYSI